MTRKKFSPEFKAEAVRAVIESSRTVAEVARDHGIGSETLRNWVNAYRRDHPDELPEISEPERAELARLRKEALHTCGGWGADTPSEAGLLR